MRGLEFFRNEILGMQGIFRGVKALLTGLGLDTGTRLGGSLLFFLYDTIKIFILLGVLIFLMSYMESYFPPQRTRRLVGGKKGFGANLLAALLGIVTPFCSCSSIPIFIGFVSAGLPLGVTFSFLIASPMVDLASLLLLGSLWGYKVAASYALLGVTIAVIGGTLIGKMSLDDQLADFVREAAAPVEQEETPSQKERISYAGEQVRRIVGKVYLYIFLGVGIGAGIHNFIPASFVDKVLGGGNPFGVLLAVLVGVPMYADIFGTIPIAEALLAKGAYLGVVLSFMMAVTTLSVPSLVMLGKVVKKKLLTRFVAICALGIVIVGYVFNALAPLLIH